ncbi:MAG: cytochrome P460 family protein [Myxococcaceae bacterium]
MKSLTAWTLATACVVTLGATAFAVEPAKYSRPVAYPAGYRDWTHLKSMVIQPGHPLHEAFGGIHHIYANDRALRALQRGKPFPDGSVFVFDLLEAKSGDNAITEGARKVVGVMEKRTKAFASTGGWGFEGFKGDTQERVVADPASCAGCHQAQAQKTDLVFSTYRQ